MKRKTKLFFLIDGNPNCFFFKMRPALGEINFTDYFYRSGSCFEKLAPIFLVDSRGCRHLFCKGLIDPDGNVIKTFVMMQVDRIYFPKGKKKKTKYGDENTFRIFAILRASVPFLSNRNLNRRIP